MEKNSRNVNLMIFSFQKMPSRQEEEKIIQKGVGGGN